MRPTWDETWMTVARDVAQRSLCVRDRVGAVIVSAQNRIIDTGYNGPPAGFTRVPDHPLPNTTCDMWCPRAALTTWLAAPGALDIPKIARPFFPEGPMPDYSDCYALHAEANALMFSDRRLREGGTIYVTSGTCGGCAKLVANSGLARAVYGGHIVPHRDSNRWYDFMRECGLIVEVYGAAKRA